jgi:hypothetical protein
VGKDEAEKKDEEERERRRRRRRPRAEQVKEKGRKGKEMLNEMSWVLFRRGRKTALLKRG